jgi:hypothetical protein
MVIIEGNSHVVSAKASLRCLIRSFNASASLLAAAILSGMSLSLLFVFGILLYLAVSEKKNKIKEESEKEEKINNQEKI